MAIIDTKKLEFSIKYIEKLANGCNPINNEPIKNESILNSPNVIRCMFFIKEVLTEVKNNNGIIGKVKKEDMLPFQYETLENFKYIEDKTISKLVGQINEPITQANIKKISVTTITKWLKNNEYLKEEKIEGFTNKCSVVTEKGQSIGLYNEIRTSKVVTNNEYLAVMYNKKAQEFIVNNLKIINNEEIHINNID